MTTPTTQVPRAGAGLAEIVRSKTAVAMTVGAAAMFGVGVALTGLAFAIFNLSGTSTSNDLLVAGAWLRLVAAAVAVIAIATVIWNLAIQVYWAEMWEVCAAWVATLVIAIGMLVGALDAPDFSEASNILTAVGFGAWMAMALFVARRIFGAEPHRTGRDRAGLWLAASVATLFVAVATGLPMPTYQDTALAITEGVLAAVGFSVLVVTLMVGHRQRQTTARSCGVLAGGLWAQVASWIAWAVGPGIATGASTLMPIKVGFSLPCFLGAASFLTLSLAAFVRRYELSQQTVLGFSQMLPRQSFTRARASWGLPVDQDQSY
jgi:hypothetical protein